VVREEGREGDRTGKGGREGGREERREGGREGGKKGGKEGNWEYLVLQVAIVAVELLGRQLPFVGQGLVGQRADKKVLEVGGELRLCLHESAHPEHFAGGREDGREGGREGRREGMEGGYDSFGYIPGSRP
jgi:hypothetical protein